MCSVLMNGVSMLLTQCHFPKTQISTFDSVVFKSFI